MRSHKYKTVIIKLSTCLLAVLTAFPLSGAWADGDKAPENMVLIHPGGFLRGADASESGFRDESPATMIYLSPYYMDRFEVSNARYTEFIRATDYPAPAYWDHHQLNHPDQPVTGVNWYDANAYCHWANKRLPTEAEWEKAARGPAGLKYPWGNKLDYSKGNFGKGKIGKNHITATVQSFPEGKSYYGLYNMAGNAFEWVSDWYDADYYRTSQEVRDPQGPLPGAGRIEDAGGTQRQKPGMKKVIRGGSWFAPAQSVTTTHRFWNDPMNNSYGVGLGFRCARDVEPETALQARAFYMEALIQIGAEKYPEALISISKALEISPDNREYRNLKSTLEQKTGP